MNKAVLVLFLTLAGCAHKPHGEMKKEVQEGNISVNAVVNLATTSFLKGCTEGYKLALDDRDKNAYILCHQKAVEHGKQIKQIVE